MPKASTMLRLLGAFAIEVNAGRTLAVAVRSRKARALLAYLAMKPDGRAGREELATLLWGDTPDAQARHSLRQCVMALRQDLHLVAPDLVDADREIIELRMGDLTVDARELASLSASADPGAPAQTAELWRGAFLADLALDIEEFAAWREREQERLADAAARAFERLCAAADAAGDGAGAIAAAERLVALDPTREDRQRIALTICARYRGREAALDRARALTELLRSELAVAPEAATRALIDSIRNTPVQAAPVALATAPVAREAAPPVTALARVAPAAPVPPTAMRVRPPIWRRRPVVAAAVIVTIGATLTLGIALAPDRFAIRTKAAKPALASAVVLPFSGGPQDQPFARALAHGISADLARYDMRMIADRTADLYREPQVDVAKVGRELDVPYAIVGRVERADGSLRADVQLIDTATRVTLWSDQIESKPGEPPLSAEDMAPGFAHALLLSITYAETRRLHREPGQPPPIGNLLLRARAAEMRDYLPANAAAALQLYREVLQRAPHNQVALLGVARLNAISDMNFVDFPMSPDLAQAEVTVNAILAKYPNWTGAHLTLAMLQKRHRRYAESMRSLERVLELNPTFLPARAQIGTLLTRMGQPQKGLALIEDTIRRATPNDPAMGVWYLFAGEAELELGHNEAALRWAERAHTFMPGAPLVQAWLAALYTAMGDQAKAATHVAAFKAMAPNAAQRFAVRKFVDGRWPRTRILQGLRVALAGPLG